MSVPGSKEWLDSVIEEIIDPRQRIIDPHHHLWRRAEGNYLITDLWRDIGEGHRIEKSVFVECGTEYHSSGPEHLRCVGETEFVASQAAQAANASRTRIAGIVAHADLRLGPKLREVLDAHEAASQGLLRGIRHELAHATDPDLVTVPGTAPGALYKDERFLEGLRELGARNLSYESWHFHYQNREFLALARAAPETRMILDHFGTPLGVGPYAGQRAAIFKQWQRDIVSLANCDNVFLKLGGMAMPDNGFGWDRRAAPPTSDEFVAAQKDYYLYAIECFGPDRCMFESNFPVDKRSISYSVLYNAFKKMSVSFSLDERNAMFYETASRVYRLEDESDESCFFRGYN